MVELRRALKSMKLRKGSDEFGIVTEMVRSSSDTFLTLLLGFLNKMLRHGVIDPTWKKTLFTMFPKTGDLNLPQNWRPIAMLRILYKLFSRLLYHRLKHILDTEQSADQVGFRAYRSVDDAFIVFETMCGKCLEWNTPLWCLSLDLSKAFDRIELQPLLDALRNQGVSDEYLAMLSVIYAHQNGRIRGSRRFDIQRGVKQGDVLSPLLFNAGVEAALRKWKIRVVGKGIYVDDGKALTNIRYADDIMLFATSLEEFFHDYGT